MKKQILCLLALVAVMAVGTVHYMAWAESKCADLGNTPQQCALL